MKSICAFLMITAYFSTTLMGINPSREYNLTPDSLHLQYEELQVKTRDGYRLNTWIYDPNLRYANNTVLILAYGDGGNMSNFVYHVKSFVDRGFTVITFDYRGFGKSDDFPIKKEFLYHNEFTTDLISVIDLATQRFPQKKIGIWAFSMGSILAPMAIAQRKKGINFLIAEGFIENIMTQITRIEEQKGKVLGLPENPQKHTKALAKLAIPVLIFAGAQDPITTTADAQVFKIKKDDFCKVVEYNAGHLRGFQALSVDGFGSSYVDEVVAFIYQRL